MTTMYSDIAFIPDYKTSVMLTRIRILKKIITWIYLKKVMMKIFRKYKSKKYVNVDKILYKCQYNPKFKNGFQLNLIESKINEYIIFYYVSVSILITSI